MSSAAATACTRTPRCRLRRTAASLNSALYSWTFFGPARGTRHLPLLGGSVYKSEAGSPASCKRLLGRCSPTLTPTGLTLYRPVSGRPRRSQTRDAEGPRAGPYPAGVGAGATPLLGRKPCGRPERARPCTSEPCSLAAPCPTTFNRRVPPTPRKTGLMLVSA